jgi:hypothetical protein
MELILLAIIILLIIISICTYCKISHFTIKPDIGFTPSDKIIEESYNYPACVVQNKCLSSNNELKPTFNYNITDNRCIKHDATSYHTKTELDGIIDYTRTIFPPYYNSCVTNYNSMYSSVVGKYIMIYRSDNQRIKFNHISVHERDTTLPSLSSTAGTVIFTTNLYNNLYPEIALDSDSSVTFENGGITGPPFSRIIITLPNDTNNIGYINIIHANTTDAGTLNGARLFILKKQDGVSAEHPYADIVFYKNIDTIEVNRTIYTYNHLNTPLPDGLTETGIKINNDWILPCTNCSSRAGNLFRYHTYTKGDTRCYVPIINTISSSDLLTDPDMSTIANKYKSCSSIFNTHYPIPNGHILYITKNNPSAFSIVINNIQFYSNYNKSIHSISSLSNLYAYVESYNSNNNLFENIIDTSDTTQLITRNATSSKIIINFGQSIYLSGIQLDIPIIHVDNLVNANLYLISIDTTDAFNISKMKVVGSYTITQSLIDTRPLLQGSQTVATYLCPIIKFINDRDISEFTDINIINSVNYTTANRYLTTYKKNNVYYQIPYINYTFSNGRSIFAKTLVNSDSTLELINNSDAYTLYNFDTNINMQTVPTIVNSHLLSPCRSRFIKISQSDTTRRLNNVIYRIEVYDNNKESIISVSNPVIIYDQPNALYSRYLTTLDVPVNSGFILIDIGNDSDICFIVITLNSVTNISGSSLELINNLGIRKFTIILNPSSTTIYIVTDINIISESGTFFLKKFNYPDCLTNSYCTSAFSDSYYIISKICFKSTADTICDNECMDTIRDYNFDNRIPYIDSNFISCDPLTETRYSIIFTWDASNAGTMLNSRDETALTRAVIHPLVYIPGNSLSPLEQSGNIYNVSRQVITTDTTLTNALYSSMPGVLYNPQTDATDIPPLIDSSYPRIIINNVPNLGSGDFTIILKYKQPKRHIPSMDNNTTYGSIYILSYGTIGGGGFALTPLTLRYSTSAFIPYRSTPIFDTWTLIMITYTISDRSLSLYVDNNRIGSITVSIPTAPATLPLLTLFNKNPINADQRIYWFNGYIADFKIYRNFIVVPPYTRTEYDPYVYSALGDHVVNWKPTNNNINLSMVMGGAYTDFIKSINGSKYCVNKSLKNSIIYIRNNTTDFIKNIKCFSLFLVYNIPDTVTQVATSNNGNILSVAISFNTSAYVPINLYIFNNNLMLSTNGGLHTLVTNYSYFKVNNIDIIGIQLINTGTYPTYNFINNNSTGIQTFTDPVSIRSSDVTLLSVCMGGLPDINLQYYANGIEMNIYEVFISGTVLTNTEFNNKYTQLYSKWTM